MSIPIDTVLEPRNGANFSAVRGPISVRALAFGSFPAPDSLESGTLLSASDQGYAIYVTDGASWSLTSVGDSITRSSFSVSSDIPVSTSAFAIPVGKRARLDVRVVVQRDADQVGGDWGFSASVVNEGGSALCFLNDYEPSGAPNLDVGGAETWAVTLGIGLNSDLVAVFASGGAGVGGGLSGSVTVRAFT